jgi:type III secretion protein C
LFNAPIEVQNYAGRELEDLEMKMAEGDVNAGVLRRQFPFRARVIHSSLALMISVVAGVSVGQAAALPHGDRVLQYSVVDQDLRDAISGIGTELGLRVDISNAVHGHVHGRLPSGTASEVMNRLGAVYGFQWVCENNTLYVSANSELTTKILEISAVDPATFTRALQDFHLVDDRWPVRIATDSGLAMIEGPPPYVAMIDQVLIALEKRPPVEVHVFHGPAAKP